jgi:hypothetical protein
MLRYAADRITVVVVLATTGVFIGQWLFVEPSFWACFARLVAGVSR